MFPTWHFPTRTIPRTFPHRTIRPGHFLPDAYPWTIPYRNISPSQFVSGSAEFHSPWAACFNVVSQCYRQTFCRICSVSYVSHCPVL